MLSGRFSGHGPGLPWIVVNIVWVEDGLLEEALGRHRGRIDPREFLSGLSDVRRHLSGGTLRPCFYPQISWPSALPPVIRSSRSRVRGRGRGSPWAKSRVVDEMPREPTPEIRAR